MAAVGQANFEAVLRENLSLVLSDALDEQGLNGTGGNSDADLMGLFARLTDPTDPTVVADWEAFAAAHADGVDGLWANTIRDAGIVVGPDTDRLAAKTFPAGTDGTNTPGGQSADAYAMSHTGGFWTNKPMPPEPRHDALLRAHRRRGV